MKNYLTRMKNRTYKFIGDFPTGDEKAPGTVEPQRLCLPILWQASPKTTRREMSLQPAPKQMPRIYQSIKNTLQPISHRVFVPVVKY